MKGNIKKLALVVIMVAIPMLIAVVTASAARKTIQGTYAFTGGGASSAAIGGFTDHTHFVPSNPSLWVMVPNGTWVGVYTFNRDGTGEMTGQSWGVDVPGPGLNAPPDASSIELSFKFTYTLDQGQITFTYVPGTFTRVDHYGPNAGQTSYATLSGPFYGEISSDGKNLTVWWGVPLVVQPTADQDNTQPLPVESISNAVQQGYRTGN